MAVGKTKECALLMREDVIVDGGAGILTIYEKGRQPIWKFPSCARIAVGKDVTYAHGRCHRSDSKDRKFNII